MSLKDAVPPTEPCRTLSQGALMVIADEYLKAVCELVVRANDATSQARLEQLSCALAFAKEVVPHDPLPF